MYYEIVRNLSVITAVEESDGRDSSVVRRPIEIVSWIRHDLYRSSDHGGVPSIGLLHSCDNT